MDVVEHLTLCENILNRSLNDDRHEVKHFEDKDGTFVLQVTTGVEDYTFSFHLTPKEGESTDESIPLCCNSNKDTLVEIKDVVIKGYVTIDFQEVDIVHLKAMLEELAGRYSREIEENRFEDAFRRTYFLSNNYDSLLEDLFGLVDELNNENIDKNLLKEGIKTIIFTGEKALALNENILYINGNIFQKRLFFKERDDGSFECKILNIGPGTPLPLAFDVLLSFHELLDYFYKALEHNLTSLNIDINGVLPLAKFEIHIKTFKPYVKLELAHYYYQQFKKGKNEYKKLLLSSILELNECISYPNLTREDCYTIVRGKLNSDCYEFLGYKMTPLEEIAGLMADYFKIKIDVLYEETEEVINMFAKYMPTANETMRQTSISIFKKEEFVYSVLLAEFSRVGLNGITDFLPRCYFLRPNEVIILEDLTELNYKSLNSNEPLSYKYLHLIVKQIAKLHACSLLYEEKMTKELGEKFRLDEKYSEYTEEKFFQNSEEKLKKLHSVGIATIVDNIIVEFPEIPKDLSVIDFKQNVRQIFDAMFEKYRNVLCHGDLWAANILFRFDSDQEPTDCRIVDYQLTRYCPPAHDLLCLLYVNTNQETRNTHMPQLIDDYYRELKDIFETHDFDLNRIYPYELFIDSCDYMMPQSICQAALYYQTSLCPDIVASLVSDREKFNRYCLVDRTEVMDEMLERDSVRIRFREIVEELYNVCVNR
ncbi:hypothetical protein NQ317_009603 [Molorchus minor]|uniref:CHK kinase-like domain-containing protein n=1 Tax=Molorchus minor TaxID=1323400 RepID=A0ABQ9IUC0_9CUCU|nr:hypothetical protein NQ317_009603 [Molorchus minor]